MLDSPEGKTRTAENGARNPDVLPNIDVFSACNNGSHIFYFSGPTVLQKVPVRRRIAFSHRMMSGLKLVLSFRIFYPCLLRLSQDENCMLSNECFVPSLDIKNTCASHVFVRPRADEVAAHAMLSKRLCRQKNPIIELSLYFRLYST